MGTTGIGTMTTGGTMTERRRQWLPWILLFLVLAAVLWADRARAKAVAKAEAAEAQAQLAGKAVDSLAGLADSLRGVYQIDTLHLTRWRTRWDSIRVPGATDTIPVEIIVQVADSTILACTAALGTCEQRVATATERGDSAVAAADHWKEAASQWQKASKGPFLRPAVEATTTLDWEPQAAFDLTLGRGAFKVLGRVELGQGAETCAFQPNTEAYSCSQPVEVTTRLGVRWGL